MFYDIPIFLSMKKTMTETMKWNRKVGRKFSRYPYDVPMKIVNTLLLQNYNKVNTWQRRNYDGAMT